MGLFKKRKTGRDLVYGFGNEANTTDITIDGVKYSRSFPRLSVLVVGVNECRGPNILKVKDTLSIQNQGDVVPEFSIRNDGDGNIVLVLHPVKFGTTLPPINVTDAHQREFDYWTDWGRQYVPRVTSKEKKMGE